MAGVKLDGAGQAKMVTLESATLQAQRLHGLVEVAALRVKKNESIATFGPSFRRAATPLVGLLKGQFGMIADIVSGMILVASRSGGEQQRVRAMREGVGQLKMQLEIAVTQTIAKHSAQEEQATAE